jgi:hypothetical protein
MFNILFLPFDLLFLIFDKLNTYRDINNFSLVCFDFNQIFNKKSGRIRKQIFLKYFYDTHHILCLNTDPYKYLWSFDNRLYGYGYNLTVTVFKYKTNNLQIVMKFTDDCIKYNTNSLSSCLNNNFSCEINMNHDIGSIILEDKYGNIYEKQKFMELVVDYINFHKKRINMSLRLVRYRSPSPCNYDSIDMIKQHYKNVNKFLSTLLEYICL